MACGVGHLGEIDSKIVDVKDSDPVRCYMIEKVHPQLEPEICCRQPSSSNLDLGSQLHDLAWRDLEVGGGGLVEFREEDEQAFLERVHLGLP
jgi:hypothetical protein